MSQTGVHTYKPCDKKGTLGIRAKGAGAQALSSPCAWSVGDTMFDILVISLLNYTNYLFLFISHYSDSKETLDLSSVVFDICQIDFLFSKFIVVVNFNTVCTYNK